MEPETLKLRSNLIFSTKRVLKLYFLLCLTIFCRFVFHRSLREPWNSVSFGGTCYRSGDRFTHRCIFGWFWPQGQKSTRSCQSSSAAPIRRSLRRSRQITKGSLGLPRSAGYSSGSLSTSGQLKKLLFIFEDCSRVRGT